MTPSQLGARSTGISDTHRDQVPPFHQSGINSQKSDRRHMFRCATEPHKHPLGPAGPWIFLPSKDEWSIIVAKMSEYEERLEAFRSLLEGFAKKFSINHT